jgi:hypothetical protein
MSIFASWLVTVGFLFGVFLVGKYLQNKERSERMTDKATQAIRKDMMHDAVVAAAGRASWESTTLGTRYGRPTEYERRSKG